MKMIMVLTAVALTLAGCATSQKINTISLGMTKAEVLKQMGEPTSTSAKEGVEFMTYALFDTAEGRRWGQSTPYYVKIVNGKVNAYGRVGDFGNGHAPEQTMNLNVKTSATEKP